jgi:hypothetical protein
MPLKRRRENKMLSIDGTVSVNRDSDLLEESLFEIHVNGVEDGGCVYIYKNGKKEDAIPYTVVNGRIFPRLDKGRYTLQTGDVSIRFSVVEKDGKLTIERTKKKPEAEIDELRGAVAALFAKVEALENKISNFYGYDTE